MGYTRQLWDFGIVPYYVILKELFVGYNDGIFAPTRYYRIHWAGFSRGSNRFAHSTNISDISQPVEPSRNFLKQQVVQPVDRILQ